MQAIQLPLLLLVVSLSFVGGALGASTSFSYVDTKLRSLSNQWASNRSSSLSSISRQIKGDISSNFKPGEYHFSEAQKQELQKTLREIQQKAFPGLPRQSRKAFMNQNTGPLYELFGPMTTASSSRSHSNNDESVSPRSSASESSIQSSGSPPASPAVDLSAEEIRSVFSRSHETHPQQGFVPNQVLQEMSPAQSPVQSLPEIDTSNILKSSDSDHDPSNTNQDGDEMSPALPKNDTSDILQSDIPDIANQDECEVSPAQSPVQSSPENNDTNILESGDNDHSSENANRDGYEISPLESPVQSSPEIDTSDILESGDNDHDSSDPIQDGDETSPAQSPVQSSLPENHNDAILESDDSDHDPSNTNQDGCEMSPPQSPVQTSSKNNDTDIFESGDNDHDSDKANQDEDEMSPGQSSVQSLPENHNDDSGENDHDLQQDSVPNEENQEGEKVSPAENAFQSSSEDDTSDIIESDDNDHDVERESVSKEDLQEGETVSPAENADHQLLQNGIDVLQSNDRDGNLNEEKVTDESNQDQSEEVVGNYGYESDSDESSNGGFGEEEIPQERCSFRVHDNPLFFELSARFMLDTEHSDDLPEDLELKDIGVDPFTLVVPNPIFTQGFDDESRLDEDICDCERAAFELHRTEKSESILIESNDETTVLVEAQTAPVLPLIENGQIGSDSPNTATTNMANQDGCEMSPSQSSIQSLPEDDTSDILESDNSDHDLKQDSIPNEEHQEAEEVSPAENPDHQLHIEVLQSNDCDGNEEQVADESSQDQSEDDDGYTSHSDNEDSSERGLSEDLIPQQKLTVVVFDSPHKDRPVFIKHFGDAEIPPEDLEPKDIGVDPSTLIRPEPVYTKDFDEESQPDKDVCDCKRAAPELPPAATIELDDRSRVPPAEATDTKPGSVIEHFPLRGSYRISDDNIDASISLTFEAKGTINMNIGRDRQSEPDETKAKSDSSAAEATEDHLEVSQSKMKALAERSVDNDASSGDSDGQILFLIADKDQASSQSRSSWRSMLFAISALVLVIAAAGYFSRRLCMRMRAGPTSISV